MIPDPHEDIVARLVDYADGDLPPPDAERIAAHLAECESCRDRLDALNRSLDAARLIWTDTEIRITAATAGKRSLQKHAFQRLAPWLATAAALLLLALGWRLYPSHNITNPVDTAPPSAAPTTVLSTADIERGIARDAIASQLLTAADLLAQQPGGREYACQRYHYIVASYADSPAALQSMERLQSFCEERIQP